MNLFIYIPTFNRPEALLRQVETLVPQLQRYEHTVRLVINLNGEDIALQEKLNQIISGRSHISYSKNFGNIGGNANIALGFIWAKDDEFIWILSDNDIVRPDCIDFVMENLKTDVDFICMRDDIVEVQEIDYPYQHGWQKPMEWRMGLISDGLYNTNTVKNYVDHAFHYHNSSFPHLAVAMAAARKRENVRFLFLPRNKVHDVLVDLGENKTDYSLAHAGMLHLCYLMPELDGRIFMRRWLVSHSNAFFRTRKQHPTTYGGSVYAVLHYGGFLMWLLLQTLKIAHFFSRPIWVLKPLLSGILMRYLPQRVQYLFRRFARWL